MSAVASSPPTPPSPRPGAEHAYDVLATRVIRQLSDADSLETKLGAAVAILVALAGAVYAAQPPRIFAAIVTVTTGPGRKSRLASGPKLPDLTASYASN